jgi:hypothetical protein
MKTVLDLKYSKARKFFLKEENYFNFELPIYFKFSKLLAKISKQLGDNNLSDYYKNEKKQKPDSFEKVNYKLLNNKDGEYAWRLFQLIHPALYVDLVHKITKEEHWKFILAKFQEFQKGIVECSSLPVLKSKKQKTDKVEQILTWWEKVEQNSIALALEYDYIFKADIVDCYGSIYTHSISWALHTKAEAKKPENRDNKKFIGVLIDKGLREMAYGQTNGIPQGSVLMDFIAEIVLGYIDQELKEKLDKDAILKEKEYKIIRYRDDYRVFVNNPEIGKEIIKELTNVLSEMGMRLNTEKTKYSHDVICESIKADKLFWITQGRSKYNLEKQLLIIYDLSKKHPNSGTLKTELHNFYDKIEKRRKFNHSIDALISILVNIAFKNSLTYPIVSAIISKLLTHIKNKKDKKVIIKKIQKRFQKLPNTEHLELWLQRITLEIKNELSYQGKLCQKVKDNSVKIWNSDWLKGDIKKLINSFKIIDQKELEKMAPEIGRDEVALFERKNNYY